MVFFNTIIMINLKNYILSPFFCTNQRILTGICSPSESNETMMTLCFTMKLRYPKKDLKKLGEERDEKF